MGLITILIGNPIRNCHYDSLWHTVGERERTESGFVCFRPCTTQIDQCFQREVGFYTAACTCSGVPSLLIVTPVITSWTCALNLVFRECVYSSAFCFNHRMYSSSSHDRLGFNGINKIAVQNIPSDTTTSLTFFLSHTKTQEQRGIRVALFSLN